MNAPRVLVCGSVLAQGVGGVQRHNRELLPRVARLLGAAGGALAVLVGRSGLDFDLPEEIGRIPSDVPPGPVLARWASESVALQRTLAAARAAGTPFDLVHTGHLPAPVDSGLPFTLTLHDLKSVAGPGASPARRRLGCSIISDAVARASKVLCVSRTLLEEVRELTGCAASRLAHVPNGADHLPARARSLSEEPFLLCVGRLEPRKDVATLLRALALEPGLPRAVLAGASQGAHEAELRELARALGVAQRVHFAGALDDEQLARLYATCACVVLPSLREGFDLPLAEALRARAPVAASELPVHRELAGGAASYFAPGDPRALAHAALGAREPDCVPALASWDDAARACTAAWSEAAARPPFTGRT